MIKNIRHTGIVVNDLKRCRQFYEKLGFKLFKQEDESGEFIEKVTGIKNVRISWVKMKTDNGDLIELIKYVSHPDQTERVRSVPNKSGCSHFTITTDNINETCQTIINNGGSVINQPALNDAGLVKVAYCYDVEGVIIEVVEEIKSV